MSGECQSAVSICKSLLRLTIYSSGSGLGTTGTENNCASSLLPAVVGGSASIGGSACLGGSAGIGLGLGSGFGSGSGSGSGFGFGGGIYGSSGTKITSATTVIKKSQR